MDSGSTPLPSFVELMATLGLDSKQPCSPSSRQHTRSSSESMSSPIPAIMAATPPSPTRAAPTKAKSTPSLREASSLRSKNTRFAPYESPTTTTRRLNSSSPELEARQPLRLRRHAGNGNLTVHVHGPHDSPPRLTASTPISSYVRRKTPTSPAFRRTPTPGLSPMGSMTLPTLPPFFPSSPSSVDSLPITPKSAKEGEAMQSLHTVSDALTKPALDANNVETVAAPPRRIYPTGIRISTPPYALDHHAEPHTRRRIPSA
ncbi:uncharacterized protein SCHCODRAFT_02623631 [Schizophyllum commune H4-8]|nr:uncharacterized protein SCHCODRAFT_02623631 [Schizophyllum commune H4-8]KAI5894067.1 hypothetical protein SCHCODRAFT_02623631 [Schizophyllum commune H4-8]